MEALKRGYRVYSFYTADLLELFHKKRNSFHFGRVYARIRDVELLVLDDLAYLPYAPEKVEYLFTLIVDRNELRSGSTIVTSNTDVTDWWQFFPSKAQTWGWWQLKQFTKTRASTRWKTVRVQGRG